MLMNLHHFILILNKFQAYQENNLILFLWCYYVAQIQLLAKFDMYTYPFRHSRFIPMMCEF